MPNQMKLYITSLLFTCTLAAVAQTTGWTTYEFLEQPTSAHITALGGANVSLADDDVNLVFQNPASLSEETHNRLGLNYAYAFADIMYGTAAYGYNLNDRNFFSIGAQYVDYGTFTETDFVNNDLGTFSAKDMALYMSYARRLSETLKIGATLKPVFQAWERKTSFGLGADVGLHYNDTANHFSAGLVFRNIGAQLIGFESEQTGDYREPLPFNIELGASWKLSHAPLRFSFTLHNLQRWNFAYLSANQMSTKKEPNFVDKAFRHAIIGVEFVPSDNFYVAVGYNHRRAAELRVADFKSMAGFSFGAGAKISKFQVAFGMGNYLKGHSLYHFSLATSLEAFGL
ncbi:MAG: type IX secretion system protein PorQ [Prevotellaceae bacterium]|jgi:hypothetical protein|nr:type IX secretion system protein PorQ [Prevotellaceae bacterium]